MIDSPGFFLCIRGFQKLLVSYFFLFLFCYYLSLHHDFTTVFQHILLGMGDEVFLLILKYFFEITVPAFLVISCLFHTWYYCCNANVLLY